MLATRNMTAEAKMETLARTIVAGLRRALRRRSAFSAAVTRRRVDFGSSPRPYLLRPVLRSQPWPGSEYDKTDVAQCWAALFSPKRS